MRNNIITWLRCAGWTLVVIDEDAMLFEENSTGMLYIVRDYPFINSFSIYNLSWRVIKPKWYRIQTNGVIMRDYWLEKEQNE